MLSNGRLSEHNIKETNNSSFSFIFYLSGVAVFSNLTKRKEYVVSHKEISSWCIDISARDVASSRSSYPARSA
jgi:hypothetical protein